MRRGSAGGGTRQGFELGRFLPYLINRTGSRLAAAFSREIAARGVSLQDWRVLAALLANGPQRLGDLAELTSVELSTLSRLIGRMSRARLVMRSRENGDRRAVRLTLTAAGRRTAQAIIPLAQHYERTALAGFDEHETERLRSMLRRVHVNLDALP